MVGEAVNLAKVVTLKAQTGNLVPFEANQHDLPDAVRVVGNRVFAELCQIKSAWRTAFRTKDEVKGYKLQLLRGMFENGINSMDLVERGLIEARKDPSDFLPSVGKFVAWCKPPKQDGELNAAMYREYRRERLIASCTEAERREMAKAELAKLRGLLNGGVA
jgi:hypothetical protein